MKEGKAFQISQNEVLNAYKAVKANKGAGGVDRIELEEFDKDWKNRLYILWNRTSSGSYYPKPVRGVEIPKKEWEKETSGHTHDGRQSSADGTAEQTGTIGRAAAP